MLSHSLLWLYISLLKRINLSQRMQVISRVSRVFLQSWKSSCQLYFSPYIPHLLAWSSILMKRLDFRLSFFSKRRRKSKDSRDQGFAKRCLKRWKCWKHWIKKRSNILCKVLVLRYFLKSGPELQEKNATIVLSPNSLIEYNFAWSSQSWLPQRQKIV